MVSNKKGYIGFVGLQPTLLRHSILYHGEQCNVMVIFLQGVNFMPQRGLNLRAALKSENLRAALANIAE